MRLSASALAFGVLALVASWRLMSVPGVEAVEYRLALPGYTFSFPRDHFSHDDYRTEWCNAISE